MAISTGEPPATDTPLLLDQCCLAHCPASLLSIFERLSNAHMNDFNPLLANKVKKSSALVMGVRGRMDLKHTVLSLPLAQPP